jgi:ketosteroid isomerase-like protein
MRPAVWPVPKRAYVGEDRSAPRWRPDAVCAGEGLMELEEAVERYHRALDEFARGDPEPVKALYSRRDDVSLANPFGPPATGWDKVAEALDYASSRFRDGALTGVDRLTSHAGPDLASILEVEYWQARVGENPDPSAFDLRGTTVFCAEGEAWRIVHRHADPITTPDPQGPLRAT